MAPEPDILLLDEPTNHLDLATIEWLEDELNRSSSALVVISHDRRFLERVSRATVWLDRGQHAAARQGFCAFRGVARHDPGGRRARAAQARAPDRARGTLAALRRHGAAQAQHAQARRTADDARQVPRPSRRRRSGDHRRRATPTSPASWSSRRSNIAKSYGDARDRQGLLDPHPARRPDRPRRRRTAPARRRC